MSNANMLEVLASIPKLLKLKKGLAGRSPDIKDSIVNRFEQTVASYPEREAIVFEDRSVTWTQLNQQANRIAHTLHAEGISRGDVVSLVMENRIEFIAAWFGIMKTGAAPALINTNLRSDPLRHCITLIDSKCCIFGSELSDAIAEVRDDVGLNRETDFFAVPDGDNDDIPEWARNLDTLSHNQPDTNLPESKEITLGTVATHIFTSGTTGLPKAAIQKHARLVQVAELVQSVGLRCTEKDRIYLTLPLYHATGLVIGAGAAFASGACLILRRKFSASNFVSDVKEHKVTGMVYIGELCRYLVNQPKTGEESKTLLRNAIGNGLRPDIWHEFKDRFGIKRLTELYAASEGNVAFANLFNKDQTVGFTSNPVALLKYDIEKDEILRDDEGRCIRTDEGEAGLCVGKISNDAPFEGYTNKDATESKVLRDVFEDGDAWFNTGDLLKKVDVGFSLGYPHYQFVDRVGDTFRWRAENVSTNEVGEVLNGFDQIDISNVYGVEVPNAEGRAGMATLTLQEGEETLDLERFGEYVMSNLSHFARPVFVRVQSEMNITGTMKLIKTDLRKEAYDLAQVSDPIYVLKPRSERYEPLSEEFLASIQSGTAGY